LDPSNEALTIAVDQGPYNNSDTTSGHGTHVAGIVAADNTDGQALGVAPGADLIGYGCGDAVLIFGVLTAYDDMIRHKDAWRIRVVNNSWGSSFRRFDPDESINQATKAAHAAGITVVFAAGNSATEMSPGRNQVATWLLDRPILTPILCR
jgi:serine protease AprX